MDNLPIQACVFIYPDGFVETVPITHYPHHLDSLWNWLENIKRFANLCYQHKFKLREYVNYMPIANEIVKDGVLSLYNFNIRELVEDIHMIDYDLPSFFVYIPKTLGSLEQTNHLERILMNYPRKKLILNYYDGHKFHEVPFEEIEKFVEEAKDSFGEQQKL